MKNHIDVTYDGRTKRLILDAPFHLGDAIRGFPSRRFDPKSRKWRVPLVRANLLHLDTIKHRYDFRFDDAAVAAVMDQEALMAKPKLIPFPLSYDFTRAAVKYSPMGHQSKMLDMAWGLPACAWFAKMGTGKSFTAIHLAFARFQAGQIDAVMILCPSTLRLTWMKELAKYATGEYNFRVHDTKAKWMPDFCRPGKRKELRILAVSVEGLGVSEALYDSACGFLPGNRVMVINDESSRIKNPDAKRTQRAINIGNSADYRIILNGTPIALGIHDLWSQYEFLDPNIIGSGDYWSFKTRYITYGGYENKQIIGYQNVEELMNLIVPYTCEVGKEVLNLPDKMMKTIYIEPTAEQKRLFRAVIKGVDADPNAPNIKVENTLEKRLRLRQITGGYLPRAVPKVKVIDGIESEIIDTVLEPLGSNPKFDAMIDMVEDNFVGTKFIIWTPFVHEIEHIAEVLRKKYGTNAVECYYGKTDKSMRSAIEDRYCNDPELRFFIGNPVAAGLGLTLISGENDVMVYYSGTEAYIERAQSEDRSHRIGQKNTVTVIDMVMVKTVDEIILASIGEKMSVEEYVMTRIAQGVSVDDLMMG